MSPKNFEAWVDLDRQNQARIAELEAEVERLTNECDEWTNRCRAAVVAFDEQKARAEFVEAEALSRTGAMKVDRQRLNMEISKWATDSDLHITIGDVEALHLAILSALEPAAPEGRQDDEPRAYIVHAPEDEYYGTGPDRLQFHPLAQHDMDNGYRQTPLYGRPAEQAVAWQHMPGCGEDRESKMVSVSEGAFCDPCIAPLVAALNTAGIETVASCCGHGHRPGVIALRDGRELFIAKDFNEARQIDAIFPIDINGNTRPSEQAVTEAAFRVCTSAKLVDINGNGALNYVVAPYLIDALKAAMEAGRHE